MRQSRSEYRANVEGFACVRVAPRRVQQRRGIVAAILYFLGV